MRLPIALLAILLALPLAATDLAQAMLQFAGGQREQGLAAMRDMARGGDMQAQLMLGKILREPAVAPVDYAESLKWLRIASQSGSGEASWLIGESYEDGHGVAADSVEAARWYEKAASQGWDQQELTFAVFRWDRAAPGPVRCVPQGQPCPAGGEFDELLKAGLQGTLEPQGGGVRYRRGPKARALIVMQRQVEGEVRLKQPRHTRAVWVQMDEGWKLFPPDAPLTGLEIVLHPQEDAPELTICDIRDVDGSTSGMSCAGWPSAGNAARR